MIFMLKFLIYFTIIGDLETKTAELMIEIDVTGENCEYSYRKSGKCQDASDCFGPSAANCQNEPICMQKSVQKCKEYGRYVYTETYSRALSVRSMIEKVSECNVDVTPLIVGGTLANEKEFPHMVAIGYGRDFKTATWVCGGSLISEKFVLSAAHCSSAGGGGRVKFARIGILKLETEDYNRQDFFIKEIINHPEYKPPSIYNDIALYKLSKPAEINGFVRPACLHASYDDLNSKKVIATGWGKTNYAEIKGSEDLRKVYLNLIDYSICNITFSPDIGARNLRKGIIPSQICAGELKGGKDTCQGDSGGPLQIIMSDPYCMYSVLGITSVGKFCGFENSPAIYTRISCFIPWIESVVWP